MSRYRVAAMGLREANDVVEAVHRHAGRTSNDGGKFAIGCELDGVVWGVAIVGRPVSRMLQDGVTVEVLRCCAFPDAPMGVCSWLYARCWRAAQQLGYRRLISYTLASERGGSLGGGGLRVVGQVAAGRQWDTPSRRRLARDIYAQPKLRWEVEV